MDREHADVQLGGRPDGSGNGVWNIVEFQVEKDLPAGGNQFADEVRPFRSKQLFANFVSGSRFAYGLNQRASLGGAWDVKRHDQPISCEHRVPV